MKGRIIAIANQKGGAGKSTTTLALAGGLARYGKKVLIVDMDAQCNTTTAAGGTGEPDVFDVLTGKATASETVRDTLFGAVDDSAFTVKIIPAGDLLVTAERVINQMGILRDAINPLRNEYDYIIIDTPPALGILTANALTAADGVIIPTTASAFGLQGITQLADTIAAIRENGNRRLKVWGILLTRYRTTRLMADMAELVAELAKELKTWVYQTPIRNAIGVEEAQAEQKSILTHRAARGAAIDYEAFITELLNRVGGAK